MKNFKLFLFSFFAFFLSCDNENYVVYRPHYSSKNNDYKYYGKPELDSIEFNNTCKVFEFYGEDYKIKDKNIILIKKKLSEDFDLIRNFTKKANDIEWLKTHEF